MFHTHLSLNVYRYTKIFSIILIVCSVLSSCKKEPKTATDGNPVLSGNDKLIPTTPVEEPVKDTATLHEIRKIAESIKTTQPTPPPPANTPVKSSPPPATTYTPPPPPPQPAPKPVDMSGVNRVMESLQNIDNLDQRATTALQLANKAEQRAKMAQQAANLAENEAADKKCTQLTDIKQETAKTAKAADNVQARAENVQKSAGKVNTYAGEIREKITQINTNIKSNADVNTTLAMAQNAQGTYNKATTELSKAENEAAAAANEAGNAETAAYNAKNLAANCKVAKPQPTTTAPPPTSINKNKIKTNLEQNFMDLSRNPRNVRIVSDIKNFFSNHTQKGIINTEKGSYSVESYITKLNLSGPMDIQITDISIDAEGNVTRVVVDETKLGK